MQFGLSAALYQAAYQHFLAGRLPEAEDACRQALLADPRHADSLHLLGVIAGQAGHPQASLYSQMWRRWCAGEPSAGIGAA